MLDFVYDNKTRIIFGKGTENEVGTYTKDFGKKVLLHYGGGSIKRFGLYDKVVESLQKEGIEFVELGGVLPNPRLSLVQEGIELCRKEKVDFILAVGGGSVIDSAKAISLGVFYDGNVWDFYEKGIRPKKVLPIGTVLTIPAAGSESSTATVITNEETAIKTGYGDLSLRPVFSILNPEITFTLPNYQTACGAVDMFGHVIERYFTNIVDVDLTDHLCEATMKTVFENASKCIKDNQDYASRADIMWAGVIAHNGLLGTGREEDWASHEMEHEISAIYDIAHGAGLAMIYPAWMKYVSHKNYQRFATFGETVFGLEKESDPKVGAEKAIIALEEWYKSIGMPTRMSDFDITDEHIELMASKVTKDDTKTIGSFVRLNKEDVINIYKLAL